MTTKIKTKLTGIPETMLISTRARYLESKMPNGIIHDTKTIEIMESIDCDFSGDKEVSKSSQWGTSVRTEILDELCVKFMSDSPDGVVVNLGCGLDTRFSRLDNDRITWYDLDVPESIELRKNFFEENERYHFIAKSALDFTWINDVRKDKPTLFIAEGLFMYFSEQEVKDVLKNVASSFKSSIFVLEAMSPFAAKNDSKHPDVKKYSAKFKWGIKSGKEIDGWNIGMKYVEEFYYFDRHRDHINLPMRLLSRIVPPFRKMMKIIHLKQTE